VALTQVVEHHLPTYVSLALAWQKGGSENLHEIQSKKWKCIVLKKQQTHVIKYAGFEKSNDARPIAGVLRIRCSPYSVYFFSHCVAIKSYNFSTSDHHQGMVVVE